MDEGGWRVDWPAARATPQHAGDIGGFQPNCENSNGEPRPAVFNRDFQVVKSGRPTQPVIGVTRRSAPDFRVRLSVNQNTYASAMTVITTKAISSSIVAAMNSTQKEGPSPNTSAVPSAEQSDNLGGRADCPLSRLSLFGGYSVCPVAAATIFDAA